MEKSTTAKGGFWMMMIEDLTEESSNETSQPDKEQKMEKPKDSYNFYPDSSL